MRRLNVVFTGILLVIVLMTVSTGCGAAKTSSVVPASTLTSSVTAAPVVTTPASVLVTSGNPTVITSPNTTANPPATSGIFTPTPSPVTTPPVGANLKAVVTSIGDVFVPGSLTVTVNTTVTWINKDSDVHTIKEVTGLFSGVLPIDPGQFSYQFTKVGTYNYYCDIHTDMTGVIIVK